MQAVTFPLLTVLCASGVPVFDASCPGVERDTNYQGHDLKHEKVHSVDKCCDACSAHPHCKYWTFQKGKCYMKSSDAGREERKGDVSGASAPAPTPPPPAPVGPDGLVPPGDPRVRYVGRFLTLDGGERAFDHPGTEVHVTVRGTSRVGVLLRAMRPAVSPPAGWWGNPVGYAANYLSVWVDGARQPARINISDAVPNQTLIVYPMADGLDPARAYNLSFTKTTEAQWNSGLPSPNYLTFAGFHLSAGGQALPAPPPPTPRRIEFIGDSITNGFCDLCDDPLAPASGPGAQDYSFGWPSLACRDLRAECHTAAWSGFGMHDNCCSGTPLAAPTMRGVHRRTLATVARDDWDAASWVPDVVVVNLGANDNLYAEVQSVQLTELVLEGPAGERLRPAGAADPDGYWADGQGPGSAIDGNLSTKWCDQNKGALVVSFNSSTPVAAYTYVTGDDWPVRDPTAWTLEGADSKDGPWDLLDTRNTTVPYRTTTAPYPPWRRRAALPLCLVQRGAGRGYTHYRFTATKFRGYPADRHALYVQDYEDFVVNTTRAYRAAPGRDPLWVLACGPTSDAYCPLVKEVIARMQRAGVRAVHHHLVQDSSIPCCGHPGRAENRDLAAQLRKLLHNKLGWV